MSNAAQFFGGRGAPRPTGALDGTSAFRTTQNATTNMLASAYTPIKRVQSGSTTAGVLKTILSAAGSGVLSFLAVESNDTTSRTHRIKVTLDGVVIFDATTGAEISISRTHIVIGSIANATVNAASEITFEPLSFNSSLLIEYADSLTESNGAYIAYRYHPA